MPRPSYVPKNRQLPTPSDPQASGAAEKMADVLRWYADFSMSKMRLQQLFEDRGQKAKQALAAYEAEEEARERWIVKVEPVEEDWFRLTLLKDGEPALGQSGVMKYVESYGPIPYLIKFCEIVAFHLKGSDRRAAMQAVLNKLDEGEKEGSNA